VIREPLRPSSRRAARFLLALAALASIGQAPRALAQSAPGNMGVPPDTAHAGLRFVYLVRHGWYDGSDPRDERIGKGLDSLGRAQATLAGERLAKLPVHIDQLVTSTFTRARETGDLIGKALHMTPLRDSLISECTPPSYRVDLQKEDFPGERDSCRYRLDRAWSRYLRPAGGSVDRHDVLVCHGNVIRWLTSRALHTDMIHWVDLAIANGSITVLVVRPDGDVRLAAFSDTGHLPTSIQTWTGTGAGWSPPPPPMRAAPPSKGIMAPAPEAAYDTLRHVKPGNSNK
jgi:serine/threonine-protein phosphatase PGAM5